MIILKIYIYYIYFILYFGIIEVTRKICSSTISDCTKQENTHLNFSVAFRGWPGGKRGIMNFIFHHNLIGILCSLIVYKCNLHPFQSCRNPSQRKMFTVQFNEIISSSRDVLMLLSFTNYQICKNSKLFFSEKNIAKTVHI